MMIDDKTRTVRRDETKTKEKVWECLDPFPGHAKETTYRLISEIVESGWREVEVGECTSHATVCDRDGDTLALVSGFDLFPTDWVIVGIDTVVTRVIVVKQVRYSCNLVGISVRDTAASQPSAIISSFTSLDTRHE